MRGAWDIPVVLVGNKSMNYLTKKKKEKQAWIITLVRYGIDFRWKWLKKKEKEKKRVYVVADFICPLINLLAEFISFVESCERMGTTNTRGAYRNQTLFLEINSRFWFGSITFISS